MVLILVLLAVLSLYVYSVARQKVSLPKPEDMAGREASSYKEIIQEKAKKPLAKGSSDLKLTGPVWLEK